MINEHEQKKLSGQKKKSYIFLVTFVAAVGGFLFGYDLSLMAGANLYLRDYFSLSDAAFGFASASATASLSSSSCVFISANLLLFCMHLCACTEIFRNSYFQGGPSKLEQAKTVSRQTQAFYPSKHVGPCLVESMA